MSEDMQKLVQEAMAKALGEYVQTLSTFDQGFMTKLAHAIGDVIEARFRTSLTITVEQRLIDQMSDRMRQDMNTLLREERKKLANRLGEYW